jgi:hypothetical protein
MPVDLSAWRTWGTAIPGGYRGVPGVSPVAVGPAVAYGVDAYSPPNRGSFWPAAPRVLPQGPANVAPFGKSLELPPWIRNGSFAIDQVVHDFGAGNSISGTGVHLGEGVVLTAGHVAAQWLQPDAHFGDQPFVGDSPYDHGWRVRYLPAKSAYNGEKKPFFGQAALGKWRDFAVVFGEAKAEHKGIGGVRATGSLKPGERVWIVGDRTGSDWRVSRGKFSKLEGDNAVIGDVVLEGGFSGSPVFDDAARLVGIAVATLANGDGYIVRTETIAKALQDDAPGTFAADKLKSVVVP